MAAPYVPQDVGEVSEMLKRLESATKDKRKAAVSCKKTSFHVKDSRDGLQVDSWRLHDWDYKKRDLPTYARGLFTIRESQHRPEIAVRGYDKFFNVDEVHETKWENILSQTQPPYELTLKENGCIIFIAGLEDDTLIVCSKHSTGDRSDIQISHASAGEARLETQLLKIGKTKADLARELRARNVTAVAELCDDSFEEHILAYGPDKAGLYLHGINLNLPTFATYPSTVVQTFAEQWGFVKTGLITMNDIQEVKTFLEEVAETGAHDGRDVEGFVIRCRRSPKPAQMPYQDWFFKYKFEEPYLMYRQWRECTKSLIAGRLPQFKKHVAITNEYLMYAKQRLAKDPSLGKEYNQNHGIIALRDDFLKFKNMNGAVAATLEETEIDPVAQLEVTRDVVLSPIATIGCGKTTIALALKHLFGWGHVQNDNISGKGRPPRFVKAILDDLRDYPVVIADRNNAQRHERKQLLSDLSRSRTKPKSVCFNFVHNDENVDEVRRVTQQRVLERGDNHQTIHAASDQEKFIGVMEGFLHRFEPCQPHAPPDNGFDLIIDLDPLAGSRANLETVVTKFRQVFPSLITAAPTAEEFDASIEASLGYQPSFKHTIPDRGKNKVSQSGPAHQEPRRLEYMAVSVPPAVINSTLDQAFKGRTGPTSKLYMQLKQTRRVQPQFHVTLMHRASQKDQPELWDTYEHLFLNSAQERVGECGVMLERVVFDDRVMAIVVRLVDDSKQWTCVNKIAHITVGTRDSSVKPKESNDLLAKWHDVGASGSIQDVLLEAKPMIKGTVKGVASR